MIPTQTPSTNGRPPMWSASGPPLPPPPVPRWPLEGPLASPAPPPPAGKGPASSHRTRRAALIGGLAGAVLAGAVTLSAVQLMARDDVSAIGPTTLGSGASTATPTLAPAVTGLDLHALIDKVEPSVVAIEVSAKDGNGTLQPVAAGSGVVISGDGLVLTNAHVVTNLTDQLGQPIADPVFTLKMHDGTVREAVVLGIAPDNDVALLRLNDVSNLTPATLGDSGSVRVGDDVVAVGNALDLGDSPTVTKGIVSALDRSLAESDSVTLHGLIQTDAPINHGNSGGALVDAEGRLIGVNSAGIPDSQNIGFAIAIDAIKPLLADLTAGKTVVATPTAFLGVTVTQTPHGVAIVTVNPGGAAAKAGMEAGDILERIGSVDVATTEQLSTTLRGLVPGATTTVDVVRGGVARSLTVELGARPK